jgi:hypothetical protein
MSAAAAASTSLWRAFGMGVGSAFVGGALGIGGGILVIPVLSKQGGFTQLQAQGTVSPLNTVTCLASSALFAYRQWQSSTATTTASSSTPPSHSVELHFDVIAAASTAALIASPLGVRLAARLADKTLRRMFAVGLTAMAPITIVKQFYVERNQVQQQQLQQLMLLSDQPQPPIPVRPLSLTSAALAGASVGFLRFVFLFKNAYCLSLMIIVSLLQRFVWLSAPAF